MKVEVYLLMRQGTQRRSFLLLFFFGMLLLSAACGESASPATSSPVRVNGFGTAANHVHSLYAFPSQALVLATHYGSYRSENAGASWKQVSGGSNQLMQGLMNYSLTVSSLDPQRLYLLTQPAVTPYSGTPGLYTSTDQGRTWKLISASAKLTPKTIFMAQAGNEHPEQVYIYLLEQGARGLKVSNDAGEHFSDTGMLPFGRLLGLLALSGAPGQLLAYGNDGMARSTDGGTHWQMIQGITGGIFSLTTAGPQGPLYASGDGGIFVSQDDGTTFTPVNPQATYSSLTASPVQPEVLYGKTGTAIYRSADGGHTWKALPRLKGNLGDLAADRVSAGRLYLSLSYPSAVYRFDQEKGTWTSLTPSA